MRQMQEKGKNKQPYQKPRLRTIELSSEEVLQPGCKLATGGTDFGDPATCIGNFCSKAGS